MGGGSIKSVDLSGADNQYADPIHCINKNQARKLLALNKLINVAKYLNGSWVPDFTDDGNKWFITTLKNEIYIISRIYSNFGTPYFRTKELAEQAVKILGEETIKLALLQV